jgi:uncharacterized membrane protein
MSLVYIGLALVIIGFAVAFIAALLPVFTIAFQQPVRVYNVTGGVGGCILLFFIPICFGFGPQLFIWPLVIVALVLAIVVIVVGYLVYRWSVRVAREWKKEYA